MVAERLPDCRAPRPAEGVVSAISHPELLTGDFAMRPRIRLTPADRAACSLWSGRMISVWALIVLVMIAISAMTRDVNDAALEARAAVPSQGTVGHAVGSARMPP
jgi:hypothetical protein